MERKANSAIFLRTENLFNNLNYYCLISNGVKMNSISHICISEQLNNVRSILKSP